MALPETQRRERRLATQQRYREKHRAELRAKGRVYADNKRCAAGQARRGSAEWLSKRKPGHYSTGERHGNWKGEQASYSAHHHWIKRWGKRTGRCAECGGCNRAGSFRKVRTDWANVSGRYLRELSDWIELCTSCHKKFDLARKEVMPNASENRG